MKAAKPSAFSWRKKKEPKEHPPLTNLTSSSSVATRDSLSKLSSPLAAPSVPPILGSLIDYEGKPSFLFKLSESEANDVILRAVSQSVIPQGTILAEHRCMLSYDSNDELKYFGGLIGAKPIEKSIEDFEDIIWSR